MIELRNEKLDTWISNYNENFSKYDNLLNLLYSTWIDSRLTKNENIRISNYKNITTIDIDQIYLVNIRIITYN